MRQRLRWTLPALLSDLSRVQSTSRLLVSLLDLFYVDLANISSFPTLPSSSNVRFLEQTFILITFILTTKNIRYTVSATLALIPRLAPH